MSGLSRLPFALDGRISFGYGGLGLSGGWGMVRFGVGLSLLSLCCASCVGHNASAKLPRGPEAYATLAQASAGKDPLAYRIGPLDTLSLKVFGEPDLSVEEVQVDAVGNVSLPLVGTVAAAGKTVEQLSRELERILGRDYLVLPQVTVAVSQSVSQRVVVEGQVTEPGIYDLKGPTTLLGALALAKGETQNAALKEVVVFRNLHGQRVGAVLDASSIRRGDSQDLPIYGSDMIVVGYSNIKGFWHDLLQASPLLSTAVLATRR